MKILCVFMFVLSSVFAYAEPFFKSESIFPFQDKHVHGSSIVELPNGDLLACWFHGSGERKATDVLIQGARLKKDATAWSKPFLMADTPELPDCNPVLYVDKNEKLWLFWIVVPAEGWQNSITKYRTSVDYLNDGSPKWNWQDIIILKPGNKFAEAIKDGMNKLLPDEMWAEYALSYSKLISESAKDPEKRQKGWMTRIHPCTLKSGRILLPLYSDGFNTALAAISDDTGKTWRASEPMVGIAGIQPSIVQKKDGTLVAYLRDSGINYKILKSISKDDGETWSLALPTDIPDPGVSVEVISLNDGAWIMIHNEGIDGRSSLVALLSDDEGKTWNWKRPIVKFEPDKGSFSYPSIIQTDDGLLHLTYSYNVNEKKTIKYVVFNTDWVKQEKNNSSNSHK